MNQTPRRLLVAVAIFACAAILYGKWREGRPGYGLLDLIAGKAAPAPTKAAKGAPVTLTDYDVPGLAQFNADSIKLTAAVMPSVVSINTGKSVIEEKRDIFGFIRGYGPGVVTTGLGSGVIVSDQGHILTNLHVVKDAQRIIVVTSDRKEREAKLVSRDEDLDLGILQIPDGANYRPLRFTDSDKTRAGEVAFALGSPFGLDFTISRGIVSATQRRMKETGNDYIQTDTVINPGNSGGPLINYRGEIIGINVSIFTDNTDSRAWQGIGLAVPANDAKEVFEAFLAKRERATGYLGIEVEMARIDKPGDEVYYAQVIEVTPGLSGDKAGIKVGDIIARFNDMNFAHDHDFLQYVRRTRPGQTVTLTVLRKETPLNLEVRIMGRPPGR